MEKIIVHVDWCDKNFGAAIDDTRIGGSVVVSDRSYDDLVLKCGDALRFHIQGLVSDGDDVPEWLVQGDYELDFVLTVAALLRRSEQFTSLTAVSRASGISRQQLSHYANGLKRPREDRRERIEESLRNIGTELLRMV